MFLAALPIIFADTFQYLATIGELRDKVYRRARSTLLGNSLALVPKLAIE